MHRQNLLYRTVSISIPIKRTESEKAEGKSASSNMSSSSCCPGTDAVSVCGVDTLGLDGICASTGFATSGFGACALDTFPVCLAGGAGDSVFLALSLDAAGAGDAPCFRCVDVVDEAGEAEREFVFSKRCVTAVEAVLAFRAEPLRSDLLPIPMHFSKCVAYLFEETCLEHTRHSNNGLFE